MSTFLGTGEQRAHTSPLPAAICALALLSGAVPLTAQESVSLFNGTDLTGWTVHGTEHWYVEDGNLVCESGADAQYGYLTTEASFTDFDLTLEFKQEADGNSGVFFRSSVEGTRVSGWQAEVAPPGLWTGGIYESYGRGWLIKPEESPKTARYAWANGIPCASASWAVTSRPG